MLWILEGYLLVYLLHRTYVIVQVKTHSCFWIIQESNTNYNQQWCLCQCACGYFCNHIQKVWIGGMKKTLSKFMNRILKYELEVRFFTWERQTSYTQCCVMMINSIAHVKIIQKDISNFSVIGWSKTTP